MESERDDMRDKIDAEDKNLTENQVNLTKLANIGAEMAHKLESVGIHTSEQLAGVGAKKAFSMLKEKYPRACLVHLYALEGAIQNVEFNNLSAETKADLKAFSDRLK